MAVGRNDWRLLAGLFFAGWVAMYANRTVLSSLLELVGVEWSLSRTELGLLTSAFFVAYTAMQVPAGVLADRRGRRRLLLPGFVLHGAGALASGLAPGPGSFLALRVLTGLGQGTYYAAQYALAAAAIPFRYRGLGTALINSGMAFGIGLGFFAGSALGYRLGLGWRWPFVLLGLGTLLLSLALARGVADDRTPAGRRTGPGAGPDTAGKNAPADAIAATGTGPRAAAFLHTGGGALSLAATYVVAFTTMYGFYLILSWLPYYLQTARGLDGATAGLVSLLMPFFALPASLWAATASDRLGRRKPVLGLLLPVAAVALAAMPVATGPAALYGAVALYGLTGKLVVDPLLVALVADATPREAYGRAFGVLNFSGTLSMALAPAVTGWLADLTGTFLAGFYLAAGLQALAWAALWAVREPGRAERARTFSHSEVSSWNSSGTSLPPSSE